MQLPPVSARWSARVSFGRYVARRLRTAGLTAIAKHAREAGDGVLAAGRALDDARFEVQDAIADRDAADESLDELAKDVRHAMASRSRDAVKLAPYTQVFPEGIEHYTLAPIDQEEARYTELRTRMEAHLPAKDGLLKATLPKLDAALKAWRTALLALTAARTAESLANTKLQEAADAFDRQMVKTYGSLVAEQGKAPAERFFPTIRATRAARGATPADPAGPTG